MASIPRPCLSTLQRRLQPLIPRAYKRSNNGPSWNSFTSTSLPLASYRYNSSQPLRPYRKDPQDVPALKKDIHTPATAPIIPDLPPLPSPPPPSVPQESPALPSFAFAFDIDGVLLHSRTPYPPAIPTLHHLQKSSVPFLLLTNGGGSSEQARADGISRYLNLTSLPLSPSHIVQSHTPFKLIASQQKLPAAYDPYVSGGRELKNAVLIVGGPTNGSCRVVAKEYGFKNVVIPEDIFLEWSTSSISNTGSGKGMDGSGSKKSIPTGPGGGEQKPKPTKTKEKILSSVWPYSEPNPDSFYSVAQPLPRLPDGSIMPIDAIFVFHDPRDWGRDIQIILDLIIPAVKARADSTNSHTTSPPPALIFSNPDLIWSSLHPTPRLGQGAFRAALEGTYRRVVEATRPDLSPQMSYVCIGKPFQGTYQYAEDELLKQVGRGVTKKLKSKQQQERKERQADEYEGNPSPQPKQKNQPLKTVYMLGDNPLSDIQGANNFNGKSTRGVEWVSILVESGVYKPGQKFPPGGKPVVVVKDVWEGVRWALKREGWE